MDDLLEQSGADPRRAESESTSGDSLETVTARAGWLRRRRFVAIAALPAVVVGVAIVAGVLTVVGGSKAMQHLQVTPAPATTTPPGQAMALPKLVSGPPGWQHGDYGNARLWVPPSWIVMAPGSGSCGPAPTLLLGDASITSNCGSDQQPTVTVSLRDLADGGALTAWLSQPAVNGYEVLSPSQDVPTMRHYAVPKLGVLIVVSASAPASVLATLGPSPRGIVLWPGPPSPGPAGWRAATYHGVEIHAPGTWPVVDGSHTGECGAPFPPPPNVYLGQDNQAFVPSCAPVPSNRLNPADGLWLQPGDPSGGGIPPSTMRTRTGDTILLGNDTGRPIIEFWYQHVDVQLGIGADPSIARAIIDSVRYAPNRPDTPATGACPSDAGTIPMPPTERLASTLLLENGDDRFEPPAPADSPRVSPQQAWSQMGAQQRGAQSARLILARVSARYPARANGKGGYTPEIQNVLVWAVYTTPIVTSAGPCSLFTLSVMDATTGQQLFGAEYGGGP